MNLHEWGIAVMSFILGGIVFSGAWWLTILRLRKNNIDWRIEKVTKD